MDAAASVFAARGIASSSVTDIAEAAQLTKGAVYSNFASKDDLILALMDEQVSQRLADAIKAFEMVPDLNVAVQAIGHSLVAAIHADGTWQNLLFEYIGLARRDQEMRAELARRRRENRAAIARQITRLAEARGVELPLSAEELTVTILAISNGLAMEGGIEPAAVPDDLFARLMRLILGPALEAERPS